MRHVLLAEPLVDEFAECFRGLDAEQLDALADSFGLDRCVRREPLLDLLREAA